MYCPSCGKEIPTKAKFCPFCGLSIKGFLDDKFLDEIIEQQDIRDKVVNNTNALEDLFLNNEDVKYSQEVKTNMNFQGSEAINEGYIEKNKTIRENILEIGRSINNIGEKIKNNKYLTGFIKYLNIIGLKIKDLQKIIFKFFSSKYSKYFQEESKFINLIITLMSFIVFIPVYYLIKGSETISTDFSKITMLLIVMVGTIIHQLVIMSGPFISLKLGSLNYMDNLDKLTSKSVIIVVSFIMAIVKLISFLLFGNISSMEFIFFGQFSFRIILITIIIILLETLLIQSLVLDKFKKENYIKLFYTLFIALIATEVLNFLIARPLMFIILELL